MSIIATYDVECDHEDCLDWTYGAVGSKTRRQARRVARGRGWVYRDGKDYCPQHAQFTEVQP